MTGGYGRHDDADGSGIADYAEAHPWTGYDLTGQRFTAHAVPASAVLKQYGLVLADELIQAAQLEGAEIAVAAALMAGESNARNIWGHDPVDTGDAYAKGGQVTRENYLVYRALMRSGRIGRQGCGPAQATSSYYQDLADALGGCWDPVANMRAGLRGLQALIRQYGVQGGAQRYNGSGPAAIAYGQNFVARYQTWQNRLFGTVVAPGPAPVSKVEPMIQNFPVTGSGSLELNVPLRGASALYGAAWISARTTVAGGTVDVWWGLSGVGGRGEAHWHNMAANTRYGTPNGLDGGDVDQATVHYFFGEGVPGVITLECQPK